MANRIPLQSQSQGTLTDGAGNALVGHPIYVYQHGTSTSVPIYQDDSSSATYRQPVATGIDGGVPGFVETPIEVDIVDAWTGKIREQSYVSVADLTGVFNTAVAHTPAVRATTAALPACTYAWDAGSGTWRLTATANAALSVDGASPSVNDRILVKNQVAQANNGIYYVVAVGDGTHPWVLARAADMAASAQIAGAYLWVTAGTVNAGAGFIVSAPGPFTLGSTAIPWGQLSVTSGATALLVANNLSDLADPVVARANLKLSALVSCRAVATGNISSKSGLAAVDGYTPSAGERLLLTAQTTTTENGIWLAASGAWTRPTDYNAALGAIGPRMVAVDLGTANHSTIWMINQTGTITVDTTGTTWVKIAQPTVASKVVRVSHTFAVAGPIAVASGSADLANYIPGFHVSVGANETVKVVKCRYQIGTGTSATFKLQKDGVRHHRIHWHGRGHHRGLNDPDGRSGRGGRLHHRRRHGREHQPRQPVGHRRAGEDDQLVAVAVGDSSTLLPLQAGRCGPFYVNGAYYIVAWVNIAAAIRVFRATSLAGPWTAQDTAHEVTPSGLTGGGGSQWYPPSYWIITNTPVAHDCVVNGNTIHIAAAYSWYETVAGSGSADLALGYLTFDCSANAWVLTEALGGASGASGDVGIAVRSNGDVILGAASSGALTYYHRTTAWDGGTTVHSGACRRASAVLGDGDRVHFLYVTTTSLLHRSVDSGGSLDADTVVVACDSTSQISKAIAYNDGVATRLRILYQMSASVRMAKADAGANPAWTSETVTSTAPTEGTSNLSLLYEATSQRLHALWTRGSDHYLCRSSSAGNGGAWGRRCRHGVCGGVLQQHRDFTVSTQRRTWRCSTPGTAVRVGLHDASPARPPADMQRRPGDDRDDDRHQRALMRHRHMDRLAHLHLPVAAQRVEHLVGHLQHVHAHDRRSWRDHRLCRHRHQRRRHRNRREQQRDMQAVQHGTPNRVGRGRRRQYAQQHRRIMARRVQLREDLASRRLEHRRRDRQHACARHRRRRLRHGPARHRHERRRRHARRLCGHQRCPKLDPDEDGGLRCPDISSSTRASRRANSRS